MIFLRNFRLRRFLICWIVIIISTLLLLENYQTLLYIQRIAYSNFEIFDYELSNINETIYNNLLKSEFRFKTTFGNVSATGKSFEKKWNKYLHHFNLLDAKLINDEAVFNSEPIIGAAISSNHFRESLKMLQSISVFYKRKIVFIYDLGLSSFHRLILKLFYGDLIIEIKRFPFETYPFYVSNLKEFRWKPLVIAELLLVFPSLVWMDASIRLHKPLENIYSRIHRCVPKVRHCHVYPWILLTNPGHSIYSATDIRMYDYLPINLTVAKNLTMYAATAQVVFGTKEVREKVLRYWVLCALEKECMNPKESKMECKFGDDSYARYAGCHRHDQSAINLILANVNNFKASSYCYDDNDVITIEKDRI